MGSRFMSIDVQDLKTRVLSALIIAPVVLFAVYVGGTTYLLTLTVFAALSLWEWLRLTVPKAEGDVVFLSYAALLLTIAVGAWQTPAIGGLFGLALMTAVYFLALTHYKERTRWIIAGFPYVAGFALAMMYLRTSLGGLGLVCYLLATVWGTDIGGYVAGRVIGGAKLAPRISPKKTWSGFIGGMALAGVFGFGTACVFGAQRPLIGLVLALILAVFSQIGDLFESWMKRRANVKESSDLIPGHGGVLDRIDGLIFAAIIFSFFQTLIGVTLNWW